MNTKTIKKYQKKSISQLKNICVRWCHEYIRGRDEDKPCVSCGNYTTLQAGHFFSGGHHSCVKFDERNISGQCLRCNFHLHGNLIPYRVELEKRIGKDELEQLDNLVAYHKRTGWKWDRFSIIDKIEYYKEKVKTL